MSNVSNNIIINYFYQCSISTFDIQKISVICFQSKWNNIAIRSPGENVNSISNVLASCATHAVLQLEELLPTCEQIYWLVHLIVQSMMHQVIDAYIEEWHRELCCRSWICDSHLGKLRLPSQGWWNRFSWSFIQQIWNFKYNWGSENLKTFVAMQMLIFLFTSPMKTSQEPFSMERLQICSLRNRYLPLGRKCGFFCQF